MCTDVYSPFRGVKQGIYTRLRSPELSRASFALAGFGAAGFPSPAIRRGVAPTRYRLDRPLGEIFATERLLFEQKNAEIFFERRRKRKIRFRNLGNRAGRAAPTTRNPIRFRYLLVTQISLKVLKLAGICPGLPHFC